MNFEGSGNLLDVLMQGANYRGDVFIADIHNFHNLCIALANLNPVHSHIRRIQIFGKVRKKKFEERILILQRWQLILLKRRQGLPGYYQNLKCCKA